MAISPAVDDMRNPVRDGILDERLKQQRRHEHATIDGNLDATRKPSPNRTRSISRNRSASCSSRVSVMRSSDPRARLSRKKSPSSTHMRRAAGGSAVVSALIECRLLKRKCGSIWAAKRSKFRLARVDLRLESAPLRLPRQLERRKQIADRKRQQIQQHAETEDQRPYCREHAS